MKRLILSLLSMILLYSVSIAGGNFNTTAYSHATPKKEIQKQNTTQKSNKRLGEKSKVVALILCLLLGWLAIHRWYLGTSDRSRLLMSVIYFALAIFLYIHVLLDFLCILFTSMDFYLDNPGIFIWTMLFFR